MGVALVMATGSNFKAADLFVFPSWKESFGWAAGEAVAAGCPVVVTEGCGIASVVADRAGLVCLHDARSIADTNDRALTDRALLDRLRAGTRDVGATLDWSAPVTCLERIYREAIEAPRG